MTQKNQFDETQRATGHRSTNPQNFDTPQVPEEPEAVRQRKERNEANKRQNPAAVEAAKIRALLNQPHFSEADMKAQLISTAEFLDTLD